MFEKFYPEFNWFIGIIEDLEDPLKLGRARVRIYSYHITDDMSANETIQTADLPWALVAHPSSSSAVSGVGNFPSGLVVGSSVIGFFTDGIHMQEPIILFSLPGINPSRVNRPDGWIAITKKGDFPRTDYDDLPDTNKLAVNDQNNPHPMLATKESGRTTNISPAKFTEIVDTGQSTDSSLWHEEVSAYDALYPNNHVTETVSGHIVEMDDTPNKERIHQYHKSGTHYEIRPDGTKSERIVKNNYEVVLGENKVYIKSHASTNIDGTCKTKVKEKFEIEVEGTINISCVGNVNIQSANDIHITSAGNLTEVVQGDRHLIVEGLNIVENRGGSETHNYENHRTHWHPNSTTMTCPSSAPPPQTLVCDFPAAYTVKT